MIQKRGIYILFLMSVGEVFLAFANNIDTTFGVTGSPAGTVVTTIGFNNVLNTVVAQSDTNIFVAGLVSTNGGTRFAVARYTATGDLDTTFNSVGYRMTPIGSRSEINGAAVQTGGTYLGTGFSCLTKTGFALANYTSAGLLNSSFNSTGIVNTEIGAGATVNSVAIQNDQNIVVAGTVVNSFAQLCLARYTPTGSLDATFGVNGIVTTTIGQFATVKQVVIQPADQKIVAVGYATDGSVTKVVLARYQTNGTLDGTFGSGGIVTFDLNNYVVGNAVALQADGKMIVAGTTKTAGVNNFLVARFTTAGLLDTTFGGTGYVVTAIGSGEEANAVVIQSNGKIVAGGYTVGELAVKFALIRYNTDGTLDITFGDANGIQQTIIGNNFSESRIASLSLQPADGKIVAVGYTSPFANAYRSWALARYNP